MDLLTAYGLVSVTAMLVFYALESRSHWFILSFAFACVMGSVYGFLQGAWPFGLVEGVWSLIAARRWWVEAVKNKKNTSSKPHYGKGRNPIVRRIRMKVAPTQTNKVKKHKR